MMRLQRGHGRIIATGLTLGRVELGILMIRGDWFVRFMVRDNHEERLLRIADLFQPLNRFIGHDLGGKSLDLANGLAVTIEVIRIVVRGDGVVLGCQPVIKAMVVGLRLVLAMKAPVDMPFTDQAGVITRTLQQCCDRRLFPRHVHR